MGNGGRGPRIEDRGPTTEDRGPRDRRLLQRRRRAGEQRRAVEAAPCLGSCWFLVWTRRRFGCIGCASLRRAHDRAHLPIVNTRKVERRSEERRVGKEC